MIKVGSAFDIHRLEKGSKIRIGAIDIPCDKKIIAHSDGDVILHALSEAIFGSLGMDDLGTYFPDSDEKTKDMDSTIILNFALNCLKDQKMMLNNIDVEIFLEEPRLKGYKEKIKESLSSLTSLDKSLIAVHAGTMEKLGSIGKGEAIACLVSLTITDNK